MYVCVCLPIGLCICVFMGSVVVEENTKKVDEHLIKILAINLQQ